MELEAGHYSFDKLIEGIYQRPQMYLLQRTFVEAVAVIEGIVLGLRAVDPNLVREWIDFSRDWLPRKLDFDMCVLWGYAMMQIYPDDKTRFEQLHQLYKEYLTERNTKMDAEESDQA